MPTEWETFYLMVGSSAVILIGLLFVVITLSSNMEARRAVIGARIYMTPTVYHLGTVVLVSAVALMPGTPPYAMALVVAVPALSGFASGIVAPSRDLPPTAVTRSANRWGPIHHPSLTKGRKS